ncbi:MAG: hypothetical protein M1594_01245 [Candidatus Marsarchaeota archaeon]|nr:hypothetical protein [Candidatus Marsarchaeota archaeon]
MFPPRLKKTGSPPSFDYSTSGLKESNVSGISLRVNGWMTVSIEYYINFKCDVCGRTVFSQNVRGLPFEVRTVSDIDFSAIQSIDVEMFNNIGRHVFFESHYSFQCPLCGRWVGKNHEDCLDKNLGVCRFCGNFLKSEQTL